MAKVTVLGGCGVVGSAAVKTFVASDIFSEVVIADIDLGKAEKMAQDLGSKVSAVKFDAESNESIKNAVKDSDAVLNTVGPYYKFEKPILSAIIEMGINYVDVCDDTGATYDALGLSEAAEKANIIALIGMGSSPGVTNLLAGYAAKDLLDECESIDMYHAHGGEPNEGPGVIGHRFYCLSHDVPMFLEGEPRKVSQKESVNYEEDIEFINLPGKYHVYPYPHPEPITMPMFLKDRGLKRVTNKGTVLPEEYYQLTRSIQALGLDSREPVDVKGQKVVPYDFAVAYLIKRRDEILKDMNFGEQRGCVKIVCKGKKKRTKEPRTYIFSLVSEGAGKGQALGEGTGIPAAFGTMLIQKGKVKKKGVLPPEACINAMDFLQLMKETLSINESDEAKKSPVIFESIDENGNVKRMEF